MAEVQMAPPGPLGNRVEKSITAADGEVTMFNITGGLIMVTSLVGIVTTAIGATTATLKLVANPTASGATADLTAVTAANVTDDAAGVVYTAVFDLAGSALVINTTGGGVGSTGVAYVMTGAIGCTFSADPVGGVIRWVIHWLPIDSDAKLVAA